MGERGDRGPPGRGPKGLPGTSGLPGKNKQDEVGTWQPVGGLNWITF